jgi:hypothetical protein
MSCGEMRFSMNRVKIASIVKCRVKENEAWNVTGRHNETSCAFGEGKDLMEEKRKNRILHQGGSSTPLEKPKYGRKTS